MKLFKLAILSSTDSRACNTTVVRYTTITAFSHSEARTIADQIGALVCGWRLA